MRNRASAGINGNDMRLVGDVNDGAGEMLVALAEVVDMVNQRDIADGKLGFITFSGKVARSTRVISASGHICPRG